MAHYRIYPIRVAQQEPRSSIAHYLLPPVTISNPIICYLIVGDNLKILVDTGCGPEQWSVEKHNFSITITPDMEIRTAIKNLGIDPDEIDFLIMTHLHHDHCWNNDQFPGKKIYVQRDEIAFAINPDPVQWIYYETAQVGMTPRWIEDLGRMEIVSGDVSVAEGIRLIQFTGHTPGSQGVLVDTEDGPYLIAGDVITYYAHWEGVGQFKHTLPNIHTSVRACYEDYEKIERLGCKILPGHDERVFEHAFYPPEL